MEVIKYLSNRRQFANVYFWRTLQQQEVDFVLEKEGQLKAFEFKWTKEKGSDPKSFLELYPGSSWQLIHSENFAEVLEGI